MFSRRSLILGAGAAFITRPALAFPVRLRNPLVFPGGSPRVQSPHPLVGKIETAFVATSNDLVSLTNGARGTISGVVGAGNTVFQTYGGIGPAVWFSVPVGGNATDYVTLAAAGKLDTTFAAIFVSTVNSGGFQMIMKPTSAYQFALSSANLAIWNGNSTITGPATSLNVPYMGVCSSTTTTANFGLLNLLTGQITTSSVANTSASAHASYTSVAIGNAGNGSSNQYFGGLIADGLIAPSYLTVPQIVALLQDPWDLWYPQTVRNLIMLDLAAQASAAPSGSNLRLLMGVGR